MEKISWIDIVTNAEVWKVEENRSSINSVQQ